MPSQRRIGRTEQQQTVCDNVLRKESHNLELLMGMLMHEAPEMNPVNTPRQRKQGISVRHPLDLIDTNIHPLPKPRGSISNIAESEDDKSSRKTSWFALRRSGSIASSVTSRKSNKSLRSTATITSTRSNGSYIRKNSGNFDGGHRRRKSTGGQRKASTISNRDQIIAEFYKELEQLEELSSSSSEDEIERKKIAKRSELDKLGEDNSKQRVEDYIMKHSVIEVDEDEGFDTNSETKDSNMSTTPSETYLQTMNKIDTTKKIDSTKLHLRNKDYMMRQRDINIPSPVNRNSDQSSFVNHIELDSKRLSELLVDVNSNNVSNKFDGLPKSRLHRSQSLPSKSRSRTKPHKLQRDTLNNNSKKDKYQPIKPRQSLPQKYEKAQSDSSCSTDSAHGSTRSISTISSCSTQAKITPLQKRDSLPPNLASGTTNTCGSQRMKSLSTSFSAVRKMSFCFKGVICKVNSHMPRTHRAFAHAGCVALIIPGPTTHKCKY